MENIINIKFDSSNLKEGWYFPESKKLKIQFNSGDFYEYYNVEKSVFDGFEGTESQGRYFNQNVKGKFEFKKI